MKDEYSLETVSNALFDLMAERKIDVNDNHEFYLTEE